jgi:hypothetical protein
VQSASRFRAVDAGNEPIPASGNGLNKAGVVGIISQRIAQPFNGGVKAVIEIAEGVLWPEFAAKFFSCNHLAGMLEQRAQDLERLLLKLQLESILAQLACRNGNLEGSEPQNSRKLGLWRHQASGQRESTPARNSRHSPA